MVENSFTTFLILHVWMHLSCLMISARSRTIKTVRYGQLDFTTELIRQLTDLDVNADVPRFKKTCVHNAFYYPCYDQGKKKTVKNATKRNRKSRKQMSHVWVVRLTCVSGVIETVCSVFMSVSVIHCNVCAYVALHFQWLPCLNIMKSVCESRDCENMSVL